MFRLIASLVVILVVVAGVMAFLAGRAKERPLTHVEQPVALGNLT